MNGNGTVIVKSELQLPWRSEGVKDELIYDASRPVRRSEIHKRHWSDPIDKIEYGTCPRCKGWETVEKHHQRLRGHRHSKEMRGKERIRTCPDCHTAFHVLADKLEYLIKEKYPLSNPRDAKAVSALMREHVWEFDELNRRHFDLGKDLTNEDLYEIVSEGEGRWKETNKLMKKKQRR